MNFKSLYLILICLFLYGCNSEVPVDQLTYKNGLKVLKESDEPFTGTSIKFEGGRSTPTEIIEYKEGKLDGHIQTWYANGELKEEFNGRLSSKFYMLAQAFGKSGRDRDFTKLDKKAMESFLVRYGEERKWYENGELESEGEYSVDGTRKIGTWRTWYKNGELLEEGEYSNNPIAQIMGSKSKKAKDNSLRIGTWKRWYENGQLFIEDGYNKDGKHTGIGKVYCKNGTLGMKMEAKDGNPVGTQKFWACDGKELDQINFVDGNQHGSFIAYQKKKSAGSGLLSKNIMRMVDSGEYDVNSEDYYKSLEGMTDNGKKSGLWTVWDEEGKIIQLKDFNKENFIDAEYSKPFLKKGKFGPFATQKREKWEIERYNFKGAKPNVEATQLYLDRKLVNPAKKIALKEAYDPWSRQSDGSVSLWTYPIIVAPEALFDVILSYPEVKLDVVNSKGQNRLHLCTILMLGKKPGRCSMEHFNYLVKHIPVNVEDNNGMAAVNYVTESFHKKRSVRSRRRIDTQDAAIKAIQTLVDAGADINHKDTKGQTALMKALSYQEYNIAKVLLDQGSDVNSVDIEQHNALHFVFFEHSKSRWHEDKYNLKLDKKRKEILILLAQKGVQIDLPDLKGNSVKDIALKHGAIKVVTFLDSLSEVKVTIKPPQTEVATLPEIIDQELPVAKGIEKIEEQKNILAKTVDTINISDNTEKPNSAAVFTSETNEVDQQEQLYNTALADIKRSRLSKPKGDSALDKLNDLSALTSENDSRVVELRRKISEKYLSLAKSRFNNYRYQDAKKFIQASQDIQPSKTATQLRAKVDQRIAEEDYIQQQNNYNSNQPSYTPPTRKKPSLGEIFKRIFD